MQKITCDKIEALLCDDSTPGASFLRKRVEEALFSRKSGKSDREDRHLAGDYHFVSFPTIDLHAHVSY
jgi:hypothetical protein